MSESDEHIASLMREAQAHKNNIKQKSSLAWEQHDLLERVIDHWKVPFFDLPPYPSHEEIKQTHTELTKSKNELYRIKIELKNKYQIDI